MIIKRATEVADAVLKLVLADLKKNAKMFESGLEVLVHPYVNGRENGWSVSLYEIKAMFTPSVSFAEYRNSDDVVVYDHRIDFMGCYQDDTRKVPWDLRLSTVGYEGKTFFSTARVNRNVAAAKFVVTSLIKQRDESLKMLDQRKEKEKSA